jgi:hypothetical protein
LFPDFSGYIEHAIVQQTPEPEPLPCLCISVDYMNHLTTSITHTGIVQNAVVPIIHYLALNDVIGSYAIYPVAILYVFLPTLEQIRICSIRRKLFKRNNFQALYQVMPLQSNLAIVEHVVDLAHHGNILVIPGLVPIQELLEYCC